MNCQALSEIRSSIQDYLTTHFPAFATGGLDEKTNLLESGAIDSLGILDLMTFLSQQFGIEIEDSDFEPSNFATVDSLARLVERRKT
jgi:acyl carrier protein